jgi:hypothetical protein
MARRIGAAGRLEGRRDPKGLSVPSQTTSAPQMWARCRSFATKGSGLIQEDALSCALARFLVGVPLSRRPAFQARRREDQAKGRYPCHDPGRGTGYILHPELYGELYNFAPTRADFAAILASSTFNGGDNVTGFDQTDLDAIVANVGYILDNRLRNIAQSRQQAIDVSAAYAFTRGSIAYTLGANATYILLSEARTAPDSPLISQVNVLGRPVDLRANAYVGLSTGLFSARLTGNYVGAYANPDTPAFPAIGDWLTFDLSARYDFGAKPGLLAGTSSLLSVRNLLNTNPPFVADLGPGVTGGLSEPIGYDPANASPLGRYIGIELRKRF